MTGVTTAGLLLDTDGPAHRTPADGHHPSGRPRVPVTTEIDTTDTEEHLSR